MPKKQVPAIITYFPLCYKINIRSKIVPMMRNMTLLILDLMIYVRFSIIELIRWVMEFLQEILLSKTLASFTSYCSMLTGTTVTLFRYPCSCMTYISKGLFKNIFSQAKRKTEKILILFLQLFFFSKCRF